jgi:hypothetical protein
LCSFLEIFKLFLHQLFFFHHGFDLLHTLHKLLVCIFKLFG